ncbi:4-alpha-glucanotransferase [Streptomyces sp. NPDC018031]|uniref:4-alpha-glucanotransferase n=1 Tax=Streptomyces sp. NPDC018031 TaxID=3365033 RepID=UPI00379CD046
MGRARLAELHGVSTSYEPAPGRTVRVSEDTVVAVLAAMGVDATTPGAVRAALDRHAHGERNRLLPPCVVARPGRPPRLQLPPGTALRVDTEDGRTRDWGLEAPRWAPGARGRGATTPGRAPGTAARPGPRGAGTGAEDLPGVGLPPGRHTLRAHAPDGRSARAALIVAPDRLPAPPARTHGLLVQLYSLLSARSWGMGDLGDLADLAAWSGRTLGSGFVQINPLHTAMPGTPDAPTDPSPYRPATRHFPDPVYLRVPDVPEYALLTGAARERADALLADAAALRDGVLRRGELIDRDRVWALKGEALRLLRAVPMSPDRRAAYDAFRTERGRPLEDHATWCALAEVYGPDWRGWPRELRDPRSPRTARARGEHLDRVDFHRWLAWLTDTQLAAAQRAARDAGMGVGLVHDLAVGVHPSGADTWARQDAFAAGMSVGAPPDAFNARGQDWGLPPWRPDALAATGYAPYRDLLRGLMRHAGALRVDHVMGLFRLWWVPEGREPTDGTYVRYDAEAMLGVLALEAHRAGAVVVGEDLGTVEPGVRETLAARGVLGTSVLWFERDYDGAVARREEPEPEPGPAGPPSAAAPGGATSPPSPAVSGGDGAPPSPAAAPEPAGAPVAGTPAAEVRGPVGRGTAPAAARTAAEPGLATARVTGPAPAVLRPAARPPVPESAPVTAAPPARESAPVATAPPVPEPGPVTAAPPVPEPGPVTAAPPVPEPGPVTAAPPVPESAPVAPVPPRSAAGAGAAPGDGRPPGAAAPPAAAGAAPARPRPLPPEAWREGCLATVTTHDLPSTAARLTGEHVELRHRLGLLSRPLSVERAEDAAEVAEWLALLARRGLLPEGPADEAGAITALYRFLLHTPARMVGVWLPDAVGDRRPQNLPGTWDQYPNWRLPIADASGRPVSLEELVASPRLRALMAEVARCAAAAQGPGGEPAAGR